MVDDAINRLIEWSRPFLDHAATLLTVVDLAAAVVFAITGALVASRRQMDIIGFMWLGVITGVGGGTVRDLLLGVPVFWVHDPVPIIACLAASVASYFTAHLAQSRYVLMLWLDAIGLALVTIAGTAKGLDAGAGPVIAVVMGVLTASFGGIIRDTLGHEPLRRGRPDSGSVDRWYGSVRRPSACSELRLVPSVVPVARRRTVE